MDLFKILDDEFHFTLDACCSTKNAKCQRFFTKEDDGLRQDWEGIVWMNPPYGRMIGKWLEKAHNEAQKGCTVVALVPSRTDTDWWHRIAMKHEVRFLKGRLYFRDQTGKSGRAPFPSAIVVMNRNGVDMLPDLYG